MIRHRQTNIDQVFEHTGDKVKAIIRNYQKSGILLQILIILTLTAVIYIATH